MIQLPISNKIMTTSTAKKVCQAILTHPLALWLIPFYVGFHPTLVYVAPLGLAFDNEFGSTCISLPKKRTPVLKHGEKKQLFTYYTELN